MRRGFVRTMGVATLAAAGAASAMDGDATGKLSQLSWLEGRWSGDSGSGTWEARYTGVEGGVILSTNKSLDEGRLRSWEYELFRVHEGAVIMQPYPNGEKSPVFFTMTALDPEARRAVFENPAHDFPQILTYHRTGDVSLRILVQARRDDELVGFELDLARVPD